MKNWNLGDGTDGEIKIPINGLSQEEIDVLTRTEYRAELKQDMKKWSDMTPRERDGLIAEKVMGLLVIKSHFSAHLFSTEHPSGHVPNYTTDISAAWEVVQKIKHITGNDGTFKIQYVHDIWICYWDHEDFLSNSDRFSQAEEAPEAICLAACRIFRLVED